MKRSKLIAFGALSALVLSLLSVVAPAQAARDLKGSVCAQEGQVRTISGVTYTCARVNGNLQYAEGRKLSGTLNVLCGAQEAWCVAMKSGFQKKTGITTKFVRLSAGEGLTRLVASKNNPEFDVWHGGPSVVFYGNHVEYTLETNEGVIVAVVSDPIYEEIVAVGKVARYSFDPSRAWLLPSNSIEAMNGERE